MKKVFWYIHSAKNTPSTSSENTDDAEMTSLGSAIRRRRPLSQLQENDRSPKMADCVGRASSAASAAKRKRRCESRPDTRWTWRIKLADAVPLGQPYASMRNLNSIRSRAGRQCSSSFTSGGIVWSRRRTETTRLLTVQLSDRQTTHSEDGIAIVQPDEHERATAKAGEWLEQRWRIIRRPHRTSDSTCHRLLRQVEVDPYNFFHLQADR